MSLFTWRTANSGWMVETGWNWVREREDIFPVFVCGSWSITPEKLDGNSLRFQSSIPIMFAWAFFLVYALSGWWKPICPRNHLFFFSWIWDSVQWNSAAPLLTCLLLSHWNTSQPLYADIILNYIYIYFLYIYFFSVCHYGDEDVHATFLYIAVLTCRASYVNMLTRKEDRFCPLLCTPNIINPSPKDAFSVNP